VRAVMAHRRLNGEGVFHKGFGFSVFPE
jgi:hypothetical protein